MIFYIVHIKYFTYYLNVKSIKFHNYEKIRSFISSIFLRVKLEIEMSNSTLYTQLLLKQANFVSRHK